MNTTRSDLSPRTLLSAYLDAQCSVILAAEGQLVSRLRAAGPDGAGDPAESGPPPTELVHDARVAIRRLRSTLRTFAGAFSDPERSTLIEEAAWYADVLGRLRDLDIVEQRSLAALAELEPTLVIGSVRAWIEDGVSRRRTAARDGVLAVLDGERYAALHAEIRRWQREPAWSEDADALKLRRRVRKGKHRLRHRIERARDAAREHGTDPNRLAEVGHLTHQARKAAKRHRYAIEVAAPVLKGDAEAMVARGKALQDRLGLIQDSVATVDVLTDIGTRMGRRSGRNAFTIGVLVERERNVQRSAVLAFTAESVARSG